MIDIFTAAEFFPEDQKDFLRSQRIGRGAYKGQFIPLAVNLDTENLFKQVKMGVAFPEQGGQKPIVVEGDVFLMGMD